MQNLKRSNNLEKNIYVNLRLTHVFNNESPTCTSPSSEIVGFSEKECVTFDRVTFDRVTFVGVTPVTHILNKMYIIITHIYYYYS